MIYLKKEIIPHIPILLVDFSEDQIDGLPEAQIIIKTLKKSNNRIYTSQEGEPVFEGINLPYWFTNIKEVSNTLPKVIQICGLYRELCLYQLASFLVPEKIPIIIDNDNYSIGASEGTIAETPWISFENRIKNGQLKLLD